MRRYDVKVTRAMPLFVGLLSVAALLATGCPDDQGMIAPGDIGAPCEGGDDCNDGLTCFRGVTGGYCTVECEGGCPSGSTCGSMGGVDFCLFGCSGDEDCREGYACAGEICRMECGDREDCTGKESCQGGVCLGDGVGAACSHPNDCQVGMICHRSMPDGYCSIDCSDDPCPSGTTCGTYGGAGYCFDDCGSDNDCRPGYVCNAGVCNLPCGDDAECAGGFVCVGDRCEGFGVGESCSTGSDCQNELSCFRGVTGGYCTHRCNSDDDCQVGSVCGSMKGELWCLAACRDDLDCRGEDLFCNAGGCTLPCASDADCADGFCDVPTGRCRGGELEVLDFGDISPGSTISFEVDSKVHSISVIAHGHPDVTYYSSNVTNPNGQNIIGSHWFGPPLRIYPMEEAFTIQIPNSDSPDVRVIPGEWRVRLDAWGASSPARMTVLLRRTPDGQDRDGGLPIEVFIAPGGLGSGVNADNAAQSSQVQGIFSRFEHFHADQAGIAIDSIRFHDLPSTYSDISNDATYTKMYKDYSMDDALNLFFVRSICLGGSCDVLGVSGGIPGPPRLGGTKNSGALLEGTGHWSNVGDGISHEAGHFMGLFHTTEQDYSHDLISDTVQCSDLNQCPAGWANLMFPFLTGRQDVLTPGQCLVIRAFGGID